MISPTKLQWCSMLAKLVAPMDAERAAKAFVDMLPLLPADDDRYTRRALERAAKIDRKTAVPTFDDIDRAFAAEWKDALPAHQRLGGAPGALRIEHRRAEPTEAERQRVAAQAAAFKAEMEARQVVEPPKVEPKYATKLQLALSASPAVLAMRPDLRAALAEHQATHQR